MPRKKVEESWLPGFESKEMKKEPKIESFLEVARTTDFNFDAVGEYYYSVETEKLKGMYLIRGGYIINYDEKLYFTTSDEGRQTLTQIKDGTTLQELKNLFPPEESHETT